MQLNEQQEAAANHTTGPACVLAAPGSGKTRVVIERARRLLSGGVRPEELLMITFTVKAAKEMKDRLAEYHDVTNIAICTFHAFCLRVLNLFSPKKFGVMDEDEASSMFWQICKENDNENYSTSFYHEIVKLKEAGDGLDKFQERDMRTTRMKDMWTRYENRKREEFIFDYQDLQINFIKAAKKHQGIREFLSGYKFISIDEFQDTSKVQLEIAKILFDLAEGNLFVVGDPKQSIYKFRGAEVQNILDFGTSFVGAVTYNLSINYRSGRNIIRHSNFMIANNHEGKENISLPGLDFDGTVMHLTNDNDDEEKAVIGELVKGMLDRNESVAILCRTRAVAQAYEIYLKTEKSNKKKVNLKRSRVVARAYDRLDSLTFMALLKISLTPGTFKNVKSNNEDILSACKNNAISGVSSDTKNKIHESLSKINKLRENSMMDVFETIVSSDDPENAGRIIDTANMVTYEGISSMDELMSLTEEYIEESDENKLLHIMTMHKSKGLEFDNVILPSFNNRYMPMGRDESEERRLAYVAYTRAKKCLIISTFDRGSAFGERIYPSKFIKEARI